MNPAENENECAMCTFELHDDDKYELKCGHVYHRECVKLWFTSLLKSYDFTLKCPYCSTVSSKLVAQPGDDTTVQGLYQPIPKSKKKCAEKIVKRCCAKTVKGTVCKIKGILNEDGHCYMHAK